MTYGRVGRITAKSRKEHDKKWNRVKMELDSKLKEERERYKRLLAESLERIVRTLSDRVERISIFGSYPERIDLFTDLDVIVVMRTEKDFLERTKEIYSVLALPIDADILCYTPDEFERIKGTGFFKRLKETVLYERKSPR